MRIVYIDAQNLHRKTLDKNRLIDRHKLYIYLKDNLKIDKVYYAVGFVEKYTSFYKKLEQFGYQLLFKKVTLLPDGSIKGNVDIDIAIQSIIDLFEGGLSEGIVATNDGDYNSLIDILKSRGKFFRLLIIDHKTAAKQLKKSAGSQIQDLERIKHLIQKDPNTGSGSFVS